jgi:hypothetical protein
MDTLNFMNLKTKDVGLRLRVERQLRQEFIESCQMEGKAAAQVLREYMREYVARNRETSQSDLFSRRPAS